MRYFPLFFLLFIVSFAQGQQRPGIPDTLYADIRCTYNFSFQENKSDTTKKWEEMELFIGEQGSVFQSKMFMFRDSIENTMSRSEWLQVSKTIPQPQIPYQICKHTQSGNITHRIHNRYLLEYYTDHRDSLQWEIGSEQREIAGMPCQQATTSFRGRKYVAWFTFQIPISEGPYKFCGLPGLLVSIADTEGHYTFSLSSIRKLEKPLAIATYLADVNLITRKDFLKIQHRKGLDPEAAMTELSNAMFLQKFNMPYGTVKHTLHEDFRQRALKAYLYKNNPVERDINFL